MTHDKDVVDSPTGWVAKHIRQYVDSDGKQGHIYNGVPALLLTTRGRKSGKLRRTALYYGQHGDQYLLIASNGGSHEHPAWYLNLAAHPEVEVQVGSEVFPARARTATPEEKARLWPEMTAIFAHYDAYQAKTSRDIPLVIIERA